MMQTTSNFPSETGSSRAGFFDILRTSFGRLCASPWLVLGLWFLSLSTTFFALLPARVVLRDVLSLRPLAERIARGRYDVGFVEIIADNTSAWRAAMTVAIVVGVAFLVLHAMLSGAVLSRLRSKDSPRHAPTGTFLVRAAETAVPMVKLDLMFALLVRVPLVLLASIAAGFALGWKAVTGLPWDSVVARLLTVAVCVGFAWSVASVWLNLARLQKLDDERLSTWKSICAGFYALAQRPAWLFGMALAICSLTVHAAMWWFGRGITARLDAKMLVLAAFLVRQGISLLRTAFSLWMMAATCALHERNQAAQPQ